MFYILENDVILLDADGQKLNFWSLEDAKQTIDYFGDDRGQYQIVSMVDFVMGRVSNGNG